MNKIFIISPISIEYSVSEQMYKSLRYIDKSKAYAKFYLAPNIIRYANYKVCTARNGNLYLKILLSTKSRGYLHNVCLFDYFELESDLTPSIIKSESEKYHPVFAQYLNDMKKAFDDQIFGTSFSLKKWFFKKYSNADKSDFIKLDFYSENFTTENE